MYVMFHSLLEELNLVVFSDLQKDKVFHAFCKLLRHTQCDGAYKNTIYWMTIQEKYNAFVKLLYQAHTDNWTEYLKNLILSMETPCIWYVSQGLPIPEMIEKSARQELQVLSKLIEISSKRIKERLDKSLFVPDWSAEKIDLEKLYFERLENIGKYGFGVWSKYHMFRMKLSDDAENGYILKPVAHPDAISLEMLTGYELQRQQVVDNTKALLKDLPASNILLYGSAGTGKSATVKAVANAFAGEGLRLIELSKNELHLLPELLEELSGNPLKFVIFVDDLSFQDNDDNFSALKAVLEGSVSARSHNVVIYATSNRRHIVRETFSQRAGDEIHRNDTMQETISLSERFGIQLLFDKPNKFLYLDIVSALAEQCNLQISAEELAMEAEKFATRKGGRSARTARQLIDQLQAKQCMKE
ncbi:MAG TPA: AAA family ATPase [Ruminococcus sp.]|nr:AAA family ATPase [Ruminococcus sp.]